MYELGPQRESQALILYPIPTGWSTADSEIDGSRINDSMSQWVNKRAHISSSFEEYEVSSSYWNAVLWHVYQKWQLPSI